VRYDAAPPSKHWRTLRILLRSLQEPVRSTSVENSGNEVPDSGRMNSKYWRQRSCEYGLGKVVNVRRDQGHISVGAAKFHLCTYRSCSDQTSFPGTHERPSSQASTARLCRLDTELQVAKQSCVMSV
jgi:hypothetical protein